MHSNRGGVVGDSDRQIRRGLAERIQRQHRHLTAGDRVVGFVEPVVRAQRDVRGTRQHHFRADPPNPQQHSRGLPVRGQQHRHPGARPGAEFVA